MPRDQPRTWENGELSKEVRAKMRTCWKQLVSSRKVVLGQQGKVSDNMAALLQHLAKTEPEFEPYTTEGLTSGSRMHKAVRYFVEKEMGRVTQRPAYPKREPAINQGCAGGSDQNSRSKNT